MVAKTVEAYGRLDVLINNAAIFGKLERASIDEISPELFDRVMKVNVGGTFLCTKAAVPVMREQRYGKIVNISTSRIFAGLPFYLHYDASKGAVFGMTRAMAKELGDDGIRVNAIAPGSTMSENVKARTDWRDGGPGGETRGPLAKASAETRRFDRCLYIFRVRGKRFCHRANAGHRRRRCNVVTLRRDRRRTSRCLFAMPGI